MQEQQSIAGLLVEELRAALRRGATQYIAIGDYPDALRKEVSDGMQVVVLTQDFDSAAGDSLSTLLDEAGLAKEKISFVSWLGGNVSTPHTVMAALGTIASLPALSGLVFDYVAKRCRNDRVAKAAMDPLASEIGNPPCRHVDALALKALLRGSGFKQIEDVSNEPAEGRSLMRALV